MLSGAYEVHLDVRPLRRPNTKEIVRIPLSKPHLAHALALEWDLLTSAQQATRSHLVPLTSLVCRALDIADDDATDAASIRASIITSLLRYLDTDTLLCLSPADDPTDPAVVLNSEGLTLRDVQQRTLDTISGHLRTHVWPGIQLEPALDGESIMPRPQPSGTREHIAAWVASLESWELAGLERATLAGKGLLGAARLISEWSEGPAGLHLRQPGSTTPAFSVEDAAKAASIEVDWQTGRWGEVEDTHDVHKEDVRRQLGSVVLLVSGTGRNSSSTS
jgi:ATP synthase F1 complex assembly factor 2